MMLALPAGSAEAMMSVRRQALASTNTWPTTSPEGLGLPRFANWPRQIVDVEPQRRGDREDGRERRVPGRASLQRSERPGCQPSLKGDVLLAECSSKTSTPDVWAERATRIIELHLCELTANRKCVPGHLFPETCCSHARTRLPSQGGAGKEPRDGMSIMGASVGQRLVLPMRRRALALAAPRPSLREASMLRRVTRPMLVVGTLVLLAGCTSVNGHLYPSFAAPSPTPASAAVSSTSGSAKTGDASENRRQAILAKLDEARRIAGGDVLQAPLIASLLASDQLDSADQVAEQALSWAKTNRAAIDADAARRKVAADAEAARKAEEADRKQKGDDAMALCLSDPAKCKDACAKNVAAYECAVLGAMYAHGDKQLGLTAPDYRRALSILKAGCVAGNTMTCTAERNLRENAGSCIGATCTALCDAGLGNACATQATAFSDGNGVPRNPAAANELLKKACAYDSANGCFRLAAAYINGIGMRRNIAAAREPLMKACDLGESMACQTYCEMLGLSQARAFDARCNQPPPGTR